MAEETKPWWQSKVLVLNLIAVLIAVLSEWQGYLSSGTNTALGLTAVVNVFLRAITKAKLTFA